MIRVFIYLFSNWIGICPFYRYQKPGIENILLSVTQADRTHISKVSVYHHSAGSSKSTYEYFIQKFILNHGGDAPHNVFQNVGFLIVEINASAEVCHGLLRTMRSYFLIRWDRNLSGEDGRKCLLRPCLDVQPVHGVHPSPGAG